MLDLGGEGEGINTGRQSGRGNGEQDRVGPRHGEPSELGFGDHLCIDEIWKHRIEFPA